MPRYIKSDPNFICPFTDVKGIIYLFENTVNGKCYVGQSTRTFVRRYAGWTWWDSTECKPLKEDVKRYGAGAFRTKILEHSKTQEELNELELKYAEQYNSYVPNGYNAILCGSRSAHKGKSYNLFDAAGNEYNINNMNRFCEEKGLKIAGMKHLVGGVIYTSQGFALSMEGFKKKRMRQAVTLERDGEEITLNNINVEAPALGLDTSCIYDLIHGEWKQYKGWKLKSVKMVDL